MVSERPVSQEAQAADTMSDVSTEENQLIQSLGINSEKVRLAITRDAVLELHKEGSQWHEFRTQSALSSAVSKFRKFKLLHQLKKVANELQEMQEHQGMKTRVKVPTTGLKNLFGGTNTLHKVIIQIFKEYIKRCSNATYYLSTHNVMTYPQLLDVQPRRMMTHVNHHMQAIDYQCQAATGKFPYPIFTQEDLENIRPLSTVSLDNLGFTPYSFSLALDYAKSVGDLADIVITGQQNVNLTLLFYSIAKSICYYMLLTIKAIMVRIQAYNQVSKNEMLLDGKHDAELQEIIYEELRGTFKFRKYTEYIHELLCGGEPQVRRMILSNGESFREEAEMRQPSAVFGEKEKHAEKQGPEEPEHESPLNKVLNLGEEGQEGASAQAQEPRSEIITK